ncbi:hypothetical protein AZE42_08324 [Rhizopogon vesiculosus]|uniref:Uncharacterized protein n=1 Tax=Rhizopogon vesiculosus TaxID=180088 RepID=A0A1J8R776_9AGAM|nr:hypothetical protein AZE42_08324 [Rhizopogon vesiculosus]
MKNGKQPAETHQDPLKTFDGHEHSITAIATFPDGKRIVTGSGDETIRIWSLADGREMKKWMVKRKVCAVLISRNGKQVISSEGDDADGNLDETVYWQLWVRDAKTGKVAAGPLDGHTSLVISLLTVAFWLAVQWIAQSFYGTLLPGRRKVNLSSVVHMSLASNFLRRVNSAWLPKKISKYGTLTEESVWLNSRATPTLTIGTRRSPGLVMAPISCQRVMNKIPSSARGTPPR